MIEMDYVTQRLDDWSGPRPWEMEPKTDTMIKPGTVATNVPDMTRFVEKSTVDANARAIDPDTFAKYDALAERKAVYRRWQDELTDSRDLQVAARLDIIDDEIYKLAAKAETQSGKRAAKTRAEIRRLEAEKNDITTRAGEVLAPDSQRVRAALVADDIKMRDLAPLVSRAYARARQKWTNTEADREAIYKMMRDGRRTVGLTEQETRVLDVVGQALSDKAPILRGASRPDVKLPANNDPTDIAMAVVAADSKIMSDAVENFRSQLTSVLGKADGVEGDNLLYIPGVKEPVDLNTRVFVDNEDGVGGRDVSFRELLQDVQNDKFEVEAIASCSLRKTS
jgi:hypothetical protein